MSIIVWLLVLSVIGGGLWSHHRFERRWETPAPQRLRLPAPARRARVVTLFECKPGDYVAVVGKIVSPEDLRGPRSGRSCVAYELTVCDGKTGAIVKRDMRAHSFVIENRGRRAVVEAANADVRTWPDPPVYVHLPSPQWVYEGRITHGQHVLVIGRIQDTEASDGAAYRSVPAAAPMAIVASGEAPLVVSDRHDDRKHLVWPQRPQATQTLRI